MDAIILWIIINFSQYPLEKVLFLTNALNPISLVKFEVLRQVNVSLWSGYSGVILKRVFNSDMISIISKIMVLMWWIVPTLIAALFFKRKDF